MYISTDLLKAEHIGVRELKQTLSSKTLCDPLVITDHGQPVSVSLPYQQILDLLDLLDELSDPQTMKLVHEGKNKIAKGVKGIPVTRLIQKIRKLRS